jgi:SPP1 family predicted phage head-tail adaptor
MKAGALNHLITLQSRSTSQDASGGQLLTWSDVTTVWANVNPLSGRELLAAQAVQSSVSHRITIRYQTQFADPKVMAKMRATMVKDGVTRIFNIHAARDENEARHKIIMDAEEGINNG